MYAYVMYVFAYGFVLEAESHYVTLTVLELSVEKRGLQHTEIC